MIAIFPSCLVPKMRLSVVLEGRCIGYQFWNLNVFKLHFVGICAEIEIHKRRIVSIFLVLSNPLSEQLHFYVPKKFGMFSLNGTQL